jgi:uncharacterized paraquat-inducible protein A
MMALRISCSDVGDCWKCSWRSLLNGGELKFDDAAFETGAMRCGRQLERNRQVCLQVVWGLLVAGLDC